ncbi:MULTISPECIES: TraR/DksA C4-type zinc finger protein [Aeromonas]|uniref:TraR/DksA C4-type zinc finger protein n=1 Tax=Aeromonas TaxID=642 RepID=UPI00057B561C|nr:TraR/DksA C4-type zinc finger protein [Aeromonas caviae]MBL0508936.1 TraR/DksA C4-type zinc finger protein [Aeromonas caviae]MBL0580046.1 TraR/DksA C4-type zinc finger protein [Aeromonas caviae]
MTKEELLQQPDKAYMNAEQQAFFRELLLKQRRELQERIQEEFDGLRRYDISGDPADIGSTEEQRQAHLRLLEREKKLLNKIEHALQLLTCGEYGWCQETGEPIGLPRLLLRPTATMSFEAKERQERLEKHLRQY